MTANPDHDETPSTPRRWVLKFADAGQGLLLGVRQSSMRVHLAAASLLLVVAAGLSLEPWRWAVLGLCITVVITAEYFNTAVEQLVGALVDQRRDDIAAVLHLAAAAVLAAALGASLVGALTLLPPIVAFWDHS